MTPAALFWHVMLNLMKWLFKCLRRAFSCVRPVKLVCVETESTGGDPPLGLKFFFSLLPWYKTIVIIIPSVAQKILGAPDTRCYNVAKYREDICLLCYFGFECLGDWRDKDVCLVCVGSFQFKQHETSFFLTGGFFSMLVKCCPGPGLLRWSLLPC